MIHVCQIDVGCRYVFDMAHGIDDVLSLKQAIEKQAGAALHEQILLISGGEVLKNQRQKLFGLSAGIEESPIYLIDAKNVKQLSQSKLQQQQMAAAFQDMSKEIDEAVNLLEPSYQTVLMRTQLAVKVYDNDFKLSKLCEQYYMDQYWQYQGFMALIANLDDTLTSIEKMYDRTREQFEAH
jgi:RB1-inducible coiled-coil protein 1